MVDRVYWLSDESDASWQQIFGAIDVERSTLHRGLDTF
jgi:hypothetical protein